MLGTDAVTDWELGDSQVRGVGGRGDRWTARRFWVVTGLCTLMTFAIFARDASAESSFCPAGSAAGQCAGPVGVAADTSTGNAYVADKGNNRIDVFSASGGFQFAFGWGVDTGALALEKCTTASGCQKGLAGSGAGQLDRPVSIAIDNAKDFVYVTDRGNNRVQKFNLAGDFVAEFTTTGECTIGAGDPVAVGPAAFFYVAHEGKVGKFSETGSCEAATKLVDPPLSLHNLAVDSTGNFYATIGGAGESLRKFSPTGSELCAPEPGREATAIAVDAADNVFVGRAVKAVNRPKVLKHIVKYNSSCAIVRRFGYEKLDAPTLGLAAYESAGGDVFATQEFAAATEGLVRYIEEPAAGPIVPPGSAEVINLSNTKATLRAEINPENKETSYHFEYLTEAEWESQGNSFTGPSTRSTPTQTLTPTDFELHSAQALAGCTDPVAEASSGTCLVPNTKYRWRIVATNADGSGIGTVEGAPFETKQPVEITDTYSTEVGTATATLNASVDPLGIPTTGYFEYVDDARYQNSGFAEAQRAPGSGELDFGASEGEVLRSVAISGLVPGTTYHYRISVTDPLLAPSRVDGPTKTFRTFAIPTGEVCPNQVFRTATSELLGDCRAYEMVSPLDKGNGDAIPLKEGTTNEPAVLQQSAISGDKMAYGSYRAFGDAVSAPFTSQYVAERGSEGWQSHTITGPRGHLNAAATGTLDTELRALTPDLCEAWLQAAAEPPLAPGAVPGYFNLYRRHDGGSCGSAGYEALITEPPAHKAPRTDLELEVQGISADGSVSVFTANDNYPSTSAPANATGKMQLFQHAAGGLSYVCVLPNGTPFTGACSAGTQFLTAITGAGRNRDASVNNAISADGQRVFWTAYSEGGAGPGQIFVRIGGTETIAVSKGGEDLSGTTSSIYLTAADDGSKAIYLTGSDLYEFDVATKATTLIAHKAAGIMGASEDASRIYLVSEEVLSGTNGEGKAPAAGSPNLYLMEGGAFTFVCTLAVPDATLLPKKGELSVVSALPVLHAARVSTDGSRAVFTSFANPTGYENIDAKNGKTDAEVYRYDATASKLLCVSCNPSKARPVGLDAGAKVQGFKYWAGGVIPGGENLLYASRALSDDGRRVFFESADALSPRDTNGASDVYEWEEPGAGRCTISAPSYSTDNGGCVELISGGTSLRSSEFDDASPSGDDVFFSTLQGLVPQDFGLVDVYDARVNGGFPVPPSAPVECEGEACQHPSPPPGLLGPASSDGSGSGNVTGPAKKCPKGKVRKKGRCIKKHRHHKKHHHRRAQKSGRAGR